MALPKTSNALSVLVMREEICVKVIMKTSYWQSNDFEWIRQIVPRDSNNTNEWTSSVGFVSQNEGTPSWSWLRESGEMLTATGW